VLRIAGIAVSAVAIAAGAVRPQVSVERVPVVVELFTSEGCSSCPPADTVLSRLAKDQPVPGVQVIPLGLHVTYWDQLGWKDPASLGDATRRQHDYGRVFGEDRIYTPQAVVDGRDEVVGSDQAALTAAFARAAKQPHARVALSASFSPPYTIVATVTVSDVPADVKEPLRRLLFVTEDGLSTIVKRGENGGRTLRHDAVVRRLSTTAEITGIPAAWQRDRLHVVALVQGERSRRIVGAASTSIR
jgi:hypothetical protein